MATPDPSATYLDAFRRNIATPTGRAARNLAAIRERIATEDAEERSSAEPPRGRWVAAVFYAKAAVVSLSLGTGALGVVAVTARTLAPSSAPAEHVGTPATDDETRSPARIKPTTSMPRRSAGSDAASAEPIAAPVVSGSPPAPPPISPAAMPPPSSERPRSAPPSSDPTPARSDPGPRPAAAPPPPNHLRAEVELMRRAQADLDGARFSALMTKLDEHARKFPTGAMLEERRAWRAIAACSLGHGGARTLERSFVARHPRSALASKVRRACADRPTDRNVAPD